MPRLLERAMTFATVLCLVVALAAPVAFANHDSDSCSLLSNSNKQQTSVAENSSPSGSRTGVSATIRAIDPNPAVSTVIVRSLYIFKDSTLTNYIEYGWKWLVDESASSHPNDNVDGEPKPFAVRVVNGGYFLSEGAGSTDPGWASVDPGTNHPFRIEVNVDGSHPNTFYFFRDGLDSGKLYHSQMQNGFVVSGSEANALCESLFTHHWSMERETGAGWNSWSNVVKLTSSFGFADRSKWWYFDKIASDEYRLDHCSSANCSDVN